MQRFEFENRVNSFDHISKLNICRLDNIPMINKAVVSTRLKVISEYDIRIPHTLTFLDWFTGQRGFIKSFKFIYRYNKPIIQIVILSTLRKRNLINFFDYLLTAYFGILKLKLSSTKVSILPKSFSFSIQDINFFYNVPNFLYNFHETINVQFFMNLSNRRDIKLFLSNYPAIYQFLKK